MQAKVKLTNEQFVRAHVVFRRNVMGWWQASFTCADGYQYSVSDSGTGRSVKTMLTNRLVSAVLSQAAHPVQ